MASTHTCTTAATGGDAATGSAAGVVRTLWLARTRAPPARRLISPDGRRRGTRRTLGGRAAQSRELQRGKTSAGAGARRTARRPRESTSGMGLACSCGGSPSRRPLTCQQGPASVERRTGKARCWTDVLHGGTATVSAQQQHGRGHAPGCPSPNPGRQGVRSRARATHGPRTATTVPAAWPATVSITTTACHQTRPAHTARTPFLGSTLHACNVPDALNASTARRNSSSGSSVDTSKGPSNAGCRAPSAMLPLPLSLACLAPPAVTPAPSVPPEPPPRVPSRPPRPVAVARATLGAGGGTGGSAGACVDTTRAHATLTSPTQHTCASAATLVRSCHRLHARTC